MSFRLFSHRLFKHGRFLIRNYFKRDIHSKISSVQGNQRRVDVEALRKAGHLAQQQLRNQGIFRFGQNARRLFVDNILNRVTNPYSNELRVQATKKFLYGDSAPFFALVGIGLASGAGVLTKDDELEGVCYEIREAVGRFQQNWAEKELNQNFTEDLGVKDLDVGPPIAKGCSAVVYAAKLKDDVELNTPAPVEVPVPNEFPERMLSPVQNIGRFIHNFGGSVDNVFDHSVDQLRSISFTEYPRESETHARNDRQDSPNASHRQQNVRFASRASRYSLSSWGSNENILSDIEDDIELAPNLLEYPLALKIMFNYEIESNAMSILKAMHKETVPARRRNMEGVTEWERSFLEETIYLPPHPNIVSIYGVFCDRIPKLRGASKLYPMALPPRLNPQGYGRNMSLFLLMKRYDSSLRDFLNQVDLSMRDRILLFAQLLEAVTHLNRHGVAHRDLKSDNILLEFNEESAPVLVLSDFGCCIADKHRGLQIPYTSAEIDKGGNTALMAPEIILKTAGTFSILDYSKADLWACGAIAYEIFGQQNPFYQATQGTALSVCGLKNVSYADEDLPELNEEVPLVIRKLVTNVLQKNPRKRISTDIAANIVQLYLWAPSRWLKRKPSSNEVLQWLLCLTTKTLCESRLPPAGDQSNQTANFSKAGRRTHTEYLLISSFLARARLASIRAALEWIHSVMQSDSVFDI